MANSKVSIDEYQNQDKYINPGHIVTYKYLDSGEYSATCSCGASWTHKASSTFDERLVIFKAHIAYDKHKPMVTL